MGEGGNSGVKMFSEAEVNTIWQYREAPAAIGKHEVF